MLIGVSGKKQSGKDTTAGFIRDFIVQHTEYEVVLMAFASPLKRLLSLLTGVNTSEMETDYQKENTFPTFPDRPPKVNDVYNALFDGSKIERKKIELAKYLEKAEDKLSTVIVEAIQDFLDMVKMSSEPVSVRRSLQWLGTDAFRKRMDNFWVALMDLRALKQVRQGRVVIITDVRFLNEMNFIRSCKGVTIRVNRPMEAGSKLSQVHASETELDNCDFDHYIQNDKDLEALNRNTGIVYRSLYSSLNAKAE